MGGIGQVMAQGWIEEPVGRLGADTARGEQPADDLRQMELLGQGEAGAVVAGALAPTPAAQRALDTEKGSRSREHSPGSTSFPSRVNDPLVAERPIERP